MAITAMDTMAATIIAAMVVGTTATLQTMAANRAITHATTTALLQSLLLQHRVILLRWLPLKVSLRPSGSFTGRREK